MVFKLETSNLQEIFNSLKTFECYNSKIIQEYSYTQVIKQLVNNELCKFEENCLKLYVKIIFNVAVFFHL